MTTLISIGELLVEFVSHQKDCHLQALAEYSGPYPSGAPAIFADQAAQCGAKSMIFGSIGDDGFGKVLTNRFSQNGVISEGVSVTDATTGTAFVSYNSDGSRNFIFHIGNTAADSLIFEEAKLPEGDLLLHISGSSLGNEKLRAHINNAVDAVIARGGKICCDPNARPEIMSNPEAFASLKEIVSKSSILLPSTADLTYLYPGLSEAEAIHEVFNSGAELVVLKRGSDGVLVSSASESFELTPFEVEEIDPTGAGDCFCGTLVASLISGKSLLDAAQLANAAGALSVTKRGPMEGNSNISKISAFIASQSVGNKIITRES